MVASGSPTAFVSYSRADSLFVQRLVAELRSAGVSVWWDQDIEPGAGWGNAIQEALVGASWVLAIVSAAAGDSKQTEAEILFALDKKKTVIPVLCETCNVYYMLRPYQNVDFTGDFNLGLKKLLGKLRVATGREREEEIKKLKQVQELVAREQGSERELWENRLDAPRAASRLGEEFPRAQQAARCILDQTSLRPRTALVLGSGLGKFATQLRDAIRIPYAEIPFFPRSTAIGHAGALVIGRSEDTAVAVMQGRVHFYEGYTLQQAAFPVRVFGLLGVKAIVLTNAAGGINPEYGRGALVVVRDHINLQGISPLTGPNDDRFGPRFPDMSDAYNAQFRSFALEESERLGERIFEGIYAAVSGPGFETPAEIRFLRTIGADLVGMSTVPEVIAARHMGIEVLTISVVTNMAAGVTGEKITHGEVLDTGERVSGKLLALLRAVLPKIDGWLAGQH